MFRCFENTIGHFANAINDVPSEVKRLPSSSRVCSDFLLCAPRENPSEVQARPVLLQLDLLCIFLAVQVSFMWSSTVKNNTHGITELPSSSFFVVNGS